MVEYELFLWVISLSLLLGVLYNAPKTSSFWGFVTPFSTVTPLNLVQFFLTLLLVVTIVAIPIFHLTICADLRAELQLSWPNSYKVIFLLAKCNYHFVSFSLFTILYAMELIFLVVKFFRVLQVGFLQFLALLIKLISVKYQEFLDWSVILIDSVALTLGFTEPEVCRCWLAIALLYSLFRLISYLWRFESAEFRPRTSLAGWSYISLKFLLGGPITAVHRWRLTIRYTIHYSITLLFTAILFFATLALLYGLGLLNQAGFDILKEANIAARYVLGLVEGVNSWFILLLENVFGFCLAQLTPFTDPLGRMLSRCIPQLAQLVVEFSLPDWDKFVNLLNRNLPEPAVGFCFCLLSRRLIKFIPIYFFRKRPLIAPLGLALTLFIAYHIIQFWFF